MRLRDKLISNATYLSLNWFFITIFSMVFWIILGKTLSPESYGTVALFFQITTVLSSMSLLGLTSAISRLIPELLERKRKDKVHGMILFSFKWSLITAFVLAMILFIFSAQISPFLKLEKEVLWMVSITMVLVSLVLIFNSTYRGFQNMRKLFLTNFIGRLSKIIFTLLFMFFNLDYLGAIVAIFLSYLVTVLIRIEKKIFTISKNPIVDKKLILKYSVPAFIIFVFSIILNESQLILLSLMKTPEVTGMFAVAMKITSIIPIMPLILLSAIAPIISGMSADKKSKPRQSYLTRLIFRYNLFFILPMAVFLIIFSNYAILFFSSPEYLSATKILIILTVTYVFNGLTGLLISSLWSIGQPKKSRNAQIISSLTYLFLSIPMTYYFSGLGLAASFLLSTILFFFLSASYLRKHLSFMPPVKDICKIIMSCLISAAFLFLARPFINNTWGAAIFAFIAGVMYLLSLLKMNFYLEEDLMALDYLAEKIPIFKKSVIWIRNYIEKFVNRSYK